MKLVCNMCLTNTPKGALSVCEQCRLKQLSSKVSITTTSNSDEPIYITKDTNPKDALGIKKVPFSTVPMNVVAEIGLGMMEGARKYGRHNYRAIGVRASVYFDATMRHLTRWWEGEDMDAESGLTHITKALTSLTVLRDAMMQDMWTDDRPPKSKEFIEEFNKRASEIVDKYPDSLPPYTEKDNGTK